MSFLAFFRYSIESVIRNRKRSLYAIIGIVIALSLIAGSWIAVDSSGIGLLRAAIREVPVDFAASSNYGSIVAVNESNVESANSAIKTVADVVDSNPFITEGWPMFANSTGGIYQYMGGGNFTSTMCFLTNDSNRLLEEYKISGELPGQGTVGIPKDVADQLELEVGDSITCVFQHIDYYMDPSGNYTQNVSWNNMTFPISQIWTQERSMQQGRYYYYYPYPQSQTDGNIYFGNSYNPIILNIADFRKIDANLTAFDSGIVPTATYSIWVDRDKVIDLADIPGTLKRLEFIQHQLAKKGYTLGFSVYDSPLSSALSSIYPELEGRKPLFLALSLPVIALGTYLSMVGVDLGVTERRREAGILKSRGASNRQVFGGLLIEALALGVFAGIMGLLLGLLVSRFLLDVVASFSSNTASESELTDFLISSTPVILCVLFGVVLMLLSSYRPFKRVSKTEISEALHHYSPIATQVEYKPTVDIILLALSILSIVSVAVGIRSASGHGWSWVTELVVFVILMLGLILFPLMPFMLSVSIVRLLTRGSRRLYAKFTWFVKPWTKELHHLVDRNIVRNPRRASNLCLIISLALAFGLFISVTMESTMSYQKNLVRYEVGSDVKLEAYTGGMYPVEAYTGGMYPGSELNLSRLSALSSINGTEHYVHYYLAGLYILMYGGYGGYSAVLFDATDYKETVKPSGFYFIDGGSEMLDELNTNGTVLITQRWADQHDILVGDVVPARLDLTIYHNGTYDYASYEFSVLVVGFVKGLPGFTYNDVFMDRSSLSFVSDLNLTSGGYGTGVLIDVAEGADPNAVADDASDVFARAGMSSTTTVLQNRLDELKKDPTFASLADFLYMEYALSIAIMTVGVGLLIFVAVHDREKELACIMARGSSGGQVRKILMGESFTLMIIGLIVGAAVGIVTAYLFNALSAQEMYTAVQQRMVFTVISLSIVLSSIVALALASLVATARAGKIKLAEVLRIRGG